LQSVVIQPVKLDEQYPGKATASILLGAIAKVWDKAYSQLLIGYVGTQLFM
jgi:hypothetical protein